MNRRRTLIERVSKPSIPSRNSYTGTITAARKQNSTDSYRVSIMPTNFDDEKNEGCQQCIYYFEI